MSFSTADIQLSIEAMDHVALTVKDPLLSMEWYQKYLGFLPVSMEGLDQGPPFILRVTTGCYLNLFPADTPSPLPSPDHNTLAMRHVALRITYSRIHEVEKALESNGLNVSSFDYGPRCRSIFIADPDGHQIELIGYGDGVFTS